MPKHQIGDVYVVPASLDNPYKYAGAASTGRERVRLLKLFRDGQDPTGWQLWFAPMSGGAKRITIEEVDWESSGL